MEKFLCLNMLCDKWICDEKKHQVSWWRIGLAVGLCPILFLIILPLKYFIIKQTLATQQALKNT